MIIPRLDLCTWYGIQVSFSSSEILQSRDLWWDSRWGRLPCSSKGLSMILLYWNLLVIIIEVYEEVTLSHYSSPPWQKMIDPDCREFCSRDLVKSEFRVLEPVCPEYWSLGRTQKHTNGHLNNIIHWEGWRLSLLPQGLSRSIVHIY
jgi:hypothetical protein